jgi:excisionase family DNA binding protein
MANETQETQESLVMNVWPDTGKALNLSKATTWRLIHSKAIPSVKLGGRYLVPKAGLKRLLEGGFQVTSN